jgi:glycyl-tRNA synthetase beta chain
MKGEYFFELLLEEIPAWMLDAKLAQVDEQLRRLWQELAGEEPGPEQVKSGATSRRLWFRLSDLPERQPDRQEEVKGPAVRVAFDAEGNPTPALQGFLRKNSASPDDVERRDDYVWLQRSVRGAVIADLLVQRIPTLVTSLRWPKMMRWGRGEHSYIRPVHSVVSVLDGEPLPIAIFGVDSGSETRGHRILSNASITVDSYETYWRELARHHVVIDAAERVEQMRGRARELAAEVAGEPAADEAIWQQWKYLTEAPGLVRAEFRAEFLELPREVLITVMRVHQKQLPVTTANGELTSSFLAVMDHHSDRDGNVRSGNSFVTNARFADAKFFHETDRRRPLAARREELSHLQFQEKLGNYLEKTERIVTLAAELRKIAGSQVAPGELEQAANLSKCDLVTEMVKEFTELQGQVGGIYAREEGVAETVWQAVYDHYRPQAADDPPPRGEVGALLAVADKLDTLAGFFSVGLKPTGSKDPFALRRAAQGVIQILLHSGEWKLDMPIDTACEAALRPFLDDEARRGAVRGELLEFIAERLRTLLELQPWGFAYDEIAAVMAAGWLASSHDLLARLHALREVREHPEFLSILDSAKRISNITGSVEGVGAVESQLLEHPSEKHLAAVVAEKEEEIGRLLLAAEYREALESFIALAPELEKFFDDVLVMAEDQRVRQNRIALLRRCGDLVGRIADVTRIVVARKEYQRE